MWNIPKRYLWSPTKKIAPDSDPFGSRTVQERMPEREGFWVVLVSLGQQVSPQSHFFLAFFFAIINMEHVDLARYLQ